MRERQTRRERDRRVQRTQTTVAKCPSLLHLQNAPPTSIQQQLHLARPQFCSMADSDAESEAGSIEPWSPSAEEEARRRCELLTLELEAAEVAGSLMSAESASTAPLLRLDDETCAPPTSPLVKPRKRERSCWCRG